jgi:hypothetical protein
MKINFFLFIFIFIFISSFSANAKKGKTGIDSENPVTETRPFFKDKDLNKPKNIMVVDDFNITYSLLTVNENCKISLEIKNISKEEKRNTFSIEAYSYANKKLEAFITEKRSNPGEIVNTQITFSLTECENIKKINFYR